MEVPKINGPDAEDIRRMLLRSQLLKNKTALQRREYFINEQLIELRKSPGVPDDKKPMIEAEFLRLMKSSHKMKIGRALRKAGEKYHVQFVLEESE